MWYNSYNNELIEEMEIKAIVDNNIIINPFSRQIVSRVLIDNFDNTPVYYSEIIKDMLAKIENIDSFLSYIKKEETRDIFIYLVNIVNILLEKVALSSLRIEEPIDIVTLLTLDGFKGRQDVNIVREFIESFITIYKTYMDVSKSTVVAFNEKVSNKYLVSLLTVTPIPIILLKPNNLKDCLNLQQELCKDYSITLSNYYKDIKPGIYLLVIRTNLGMVSLYVTVDINLNTKLLFKL